MSFWLAKRAFSNVRADFYEDTAEALEDKADLVSELSKLRTRYMSRGNPLYKLFSHWLKRMDSGSFSQAISGTVPALDVMVMASAERAGNLSEGMRFLSKCIRVSAVMQASVRSAVVGPIGIVIMVAVLMSLFALFMVPILLQISPVHKWPMLGRLLYSMSQIIVGYWYILITVAFALSTSFTMSLTRWTGQLRSTVERFLIPYRLYRDYTAALFLVSLAAMMQTGASLVDSLDTLQANASPYLRWQIGKMLRKLDLTPNEPAKALDVGLLPRMLADRVIDFGARGEFAKALEKVGLSSVDKVAKQVASSAKILNTVLLLCAGMVMALMIAGVLLTSQSAMSSIKSQLH